MAQDSGLKPLSNELCMATVLVAVVLPFLCLSCGNKGKQFAEAITSRDSVSVMTTYGVDMLISENGAVHYHVTTDEWMVFDRMKPAYYSMEKGVYLEVYDSLMQVTSTLRADTAYYYIDNEIWKLIGNVHAQNVNDDVFDAPLLFMDNRTNRIYSEDSISIRQPDRVLKGKGFESNGNMTEYFIRHTTGIFPIRDTQNPDSIAADSIAADSIVPAQDNIAIE